ncbi:MAG: hypothetical protein Q4C49_08030 [Bacillota bacterium]|nr:hypothetical protein [Bacillota bacterium]
MRKIAQKSDIANEWLYIVESLLSIWHKEPFEYPSTWVCYNKTLELNEIQKRIREKDSLPLWFVQYSNQANQMFSNMCLDCRKDKKENPNHEPSVDLLEKIQIFRNSWKQLNSRD